MPEFILARSRVGARFVWKSLKHHQNYSDMPVFILRKSGLDVLPVSWNSATLVIWMRMSVFILARSPLNVRSVTGSSINLLIWKSCYLEINPSTLEQEGHEIKIEESNGELQEVSVMQTEVTKNNHNSDQGQANSNPQRCWKVNREGSASSDLNATCVVNFLFQRSQ